MGYRIFRIRNILGERLSRPGGVTREKAVQEAGRRVETLRAPYEDAIAVEIAKLEKIVAAAGAEIAARQLAQLLDGAGRLLILTGTFGFGLLDAVTKSLCDLCVGMLEKSIVATAPLAVHLNAMRLAWKMEMSEAEGEEMLGELARIHAYYGIKPHMPDES